MNAAQMIDAGFDTGNYDPTEVQVLVRDIWHESHKQVIQPDAAPKSGAAAAYLVSLREMTKRPENVARQPQNLLCWKHTPELHKKMIVTAAGLDASVVKKNDRELSETEKTLIRTAASDLRDFAGEVVRWL
jgi:hypothetical protein